MWFRQLQLSSEESSDIPHMALCLPSNLFTSFAIHQD
jgi:hypothetical protein